MATYSNESYQLRLGLLDDDGDDDEADECVDVDAERLVADCSYDADADDAAADDADDRDDGDGDDDCDCADSGDTRAV